MHQNILKYREKCAHKMLESKKKSRKCTKLPDILADFQLFTFADFQVVAVPVEGAAVDEGRDEEVPPGTGGHGHCHATR